MMFQTTCTWTFEWPSGNSKRGWPVNKVIWLKRGSRNCRASG